MKNSILSFIFFFIILALNAQNDTKNTLTNIEINLGRSFHGTGDMPGYQFGFIYTSSISNKLNWFVGLEGTLHDKDINLLTFQDPNTGKTFDGTLHGVTGGIQFLGGIKYNFIQSSKYNFGLSLGTVFRYQATSLNDSVTTLFPVITDLPVPVRIITNFEPQRTFAVGGVLKLEYQYNISSKHFLGLVGGFQTDTNEDVISYAALGFGFRL